MTDRARRVEFTVSEETWKRLEAARGFEARSSFARRALEKALGAGEGSPQDPVGAGRATRETDRRSRSASSRAPVEKEPSEAKGLAAGVQADPGPVGSKVVPVRSAAPSRRANPALVRQAALNKQKGLSQ